MIDDEAPESLRTAICDLNGQMRGKRLTGDQLAKIEFSGLRLPLSALNVDLWGADILDSPLVYSSGDADGQLRITDRGPVPMPWLAPGTDLVPMWLFTDDGRPFAGDPRHALGRVLERFHRQGWKVTAAMELEFTLIDPNSEPPKAEGEVASVLGVEELDRHADLFDEIFQGAKAMDIPVEGALSEGGLGQFEVNLSYGPAMRMADDVWLTKQLVRGMAAKHGLTASFMAKPIADEPGNSMHCHISIQDRQGRNLFDNGLHTGTSLMHAAIAGCLASMPGATLIFAPWENSFHRLTPETHAPTGVSWGYENRTTAIRVPGGDPAARRIEHRVPGSDANPYLALAAILGGMLIGVEDELSPPEPVIGNAYEQRALKFPLDWDTAIQSFSESPKIARILPPAIISYYVAMKRQEQRRMSDLSPEAKMRVMLQGV